MTNLSPEIMIKRNVDRLRSRIENAALASDRRSDDVKLIAVTKYVDAEIVRLLVEAGCTTLGESRPQVLWEKSEQVSDLPIEWHMIGHLQRNKVKRTLEFTRWIHSVDSERLLSEINGAAANDTGPVNVLLEINVSGDKNKNGLTHEAASNLIDKSAELPHITITGLMCMGGLNSDEAELRSQFSTLRLLRDKFQQRLPSVRELSMGMSGDFEVAIEEGSTMVRVGSALYEGVR